MNRVELLQRILDTEQILGRKVAADIDILGNHGSAVGNDGIPADHNKIHAVLAQ